MVGADSGKEKWERGRRKEEGKEHRCRNGRGHGGWQSVTMINSLEHGWGLGNRRNARGCFPTGDRSIQSVTRDCKLLV